MSKAHREVDRNIFSHVSLYYSINTHPHNLPFHHSKLDYVSIILSFGLLILEKSVPRTFVWGKCSPELPTGLNRKGAWTGGKSCEVYQVPVK